MARRIVLAVFVSLTLLAAGLGAYSLLWPERPPSVIDPTHTPSNTPQTASLADLARTDPVAMLDACLSRYAKDAKGFRATLDKQERVAGVLRERELVQVVGWGEVPDAPGAEPKVRVRMIWEQGAQKDLLGNAVRGTVFVAGENKDQILTFRPDAWMKEMAVDAKGSLARGASRYCIRDSGLYRGTLRTYTAWKKHKDAGDLRTEYVGTQVVEKAGGRECHVVKRLCATPEVDSFALDEAAPTDPKTVERDGFTEVTLMIDAERWLQVGTVIRRANGDLLGEYFFRDIELVTQPFPDGTFTVAAMKGGKK